MPEHQTVRNVEPPVPDDEVLAAAVQYVQNDAALDRAVAAVAHATDHLLAELVASAAPRDREIEAERRGRAPPPASAAPRPGPADW